MSRITRARPLLGTFVEIWADADDPREAEAAIRAAFGEIGRIETRLNYHSAESELSRINCARPGERTVISAETHRLFRTIGELHRESGGVFDPTVAGRLERIGYPSGAGPLRPGFPEGSWGDVELIGDDRLVLHAPVRIDLSGIAKGYAVDSAYALLEAWGVKRFCVNAGGDLRIRSDVPESVAIRHPLTPSAVGEVIALQEGAAATSAGYYSLRCEAGETFTPLLHPLSGRSAPATVSVTVLAPICTLADALTKVVHADAEGACGLLSRFGAEALILSPGGVGSAGGIEKRVIPGA